MKNLVIIESPFAGRGEDDETKERDHSDNVLYARRAVRDSVTQQNEAPIASHLLFTQAGILRDDAPAERALGIEAGLAWRFMANYTVFYVDRGWSNGMKAALKLCRAEHRPYKIRSLTMDVTLDEPEDI